jgi:hypothetical protein
VRQAIDRRPNDIKDVLRGAGMRRDFFGGVADDETKVLKAFQEKNAENALKVRPKVSVFYFFHFSFTASTTRGKVVFASIDASAAATANPACLCSAQWQKRVTGAWK